jgi:hemoglobin
MKHLGALACVLFLGCGGSSKHAATTTSSTGSGSPDPTQAAANTGPSETGITPTPPAPKSLYDRLGGKPAVTAVVDEFVARTTGDDKIKDRFFNVDADNLKTLLVEFVCAAGGGGCQYEGRDMGTSHASMVLVEDEFNALVGDLVGALDKFHVPEKEKGELLGALGPLKPQIVASADKLHPIDQAKLDAVTKLAATVKDPEAQRLLGVAVIAGQRGQRSYAEQLFTRAEMITGPAPLAKIASTFRAGAPARITTATKKMTDNGPQPASAGGDDEAEAPKPKAKIGMLHGALKINGAAPTGLSVVMLTPAGGGGGKRTPKQRVVEQRNKSFAPHVMAVPAGSTVAFPNFDSIFHNVFSLSKSKAFDLGMYKNGETRDVKFDKPGIVRLGCNLHANMAAYIIVVDAPHYVVAENGSYSFKALSPGKYKVQAWSESGGDPVSGEVTVAEGDNTQDLDLQPGQAGLGTDKFNNPR